MRILGLEFGAWSLKAVEMESRFRRVEVLDFHEVRLPLEILDPVTVYREAVAKLMARLPAGVEKTATSVPAAQTALRFLQVPVKSRKTVEKMFRFEIEDNVPFKLEDALLEHQVYRAGEGSLVFVAMAPKHLVQGHLEWLQAVGINPDWLTFDGMGLLNLYFAQTPTKGPEAPEGPVMLLDIGHAKTTLAIAYQGRLEHLRTVHWGGGTITRAIALSLGISLDDAEKLKCHEIALDADTEKASNPDALVAASQACTPLTTDITHSLVAYRNTYQREVSSVVVTGGTSRLKGLSSVIAATVGAPVQPFAAFKEQSIKPDVKDMADEMRFAEPLGRASVFLRKTSLLFNFRKADMAKETSLDEVSQFVQNPLVVRALIYAAALAVVLYANAWVSGWLADRELRTTRAELQKVFTATFPGVPAKTGRSLTTNPQMLGKFVDQKKRELEQKLKMLDRDKTPMLSRVLALSSAFPDGLKVDVNSLDINDRGVRIEGVVYQGELEQAKESLEKFPWLKEVEMQVEDKRFTLRAALVDKL